MPNQMIALQSRGAPLPDPSRQTAQFANMMNMARQQEAAALQAQRARQEMQYAEAAEGRAAALQPSALTKAEGDAGVAKIKYVMDFYNASANDIANATDPEQAIARGERLKQQFTDPVLQARIDETIRELVSDPSKFEENRKRILIRTLDAKDQFAVTHKDVFDADGNLILMETSPTGSFPTRVTPGVITNLPSTATASPPAAAPRPPVGTGADMRATQGSNTTPQDLINQGMNPNNIPSGMPTSPASFTGGMGGAGAGQMTPEVMSRIADSAFQTGVIAQVDFDQLLATQPPENRQAFTDAFRRANVTVQPNAPSLADSGMGQQQMAVNPVQTPQAGFADLRGPTPQSRTANLGGDMSTMRTTEAQYQVGQQVKGKNLNLSPAPAETPEQAGRRALLGRSSPAEEAAKAQATQNVNLQMAPQIAAATKKAENAIALKSEAPKEKYIATRLIANIDDRIATIDRLLRNPERRSIIGRFEGNTPYFLQNETQSDAQADFDKIKNTDTLTSLVELKQDSPSGGSPVGNASNSDVVLVAKGANALIQTGTLPKFDAELMEIRRQLYRTRTNVINFYGDRYGDVIAGNPSLKLNAPKIADRYISTKDMPKPRTSTKVDRNNPLLRGM
jgi:hypothetical protein